MENMASAPDSSTGSGIAPCPPTAVAVSDKSSPASTVPSLKVFDESFSSQLDMIERQAALQPKSNTVQPPRVDLTAIRNVPTKDDFLQSRSQDHQAVPSRRKQRHVDNGLYGGRGIVGMPIHATAPFPTPVAPMGRPTQYSGRNYDTYVGYTMGTHGCGTVEVETAAEYGGGQACNACDPGH